MLPLSSDSRQDPIILFFLLVLMLIFIIWNIFKSQIYLYFPDASWVHYHWYVLLNTEISPNYKIRCLSQLISVNFDIKRLSDDCLEYFSCLHHLTVFLNEYYIHCCKSFFFSVFFLSFFNTYSLVLTDSGYIFIILFNSLHYDNIISVLSNSSPNYI